MYKRLRQVRRDKNVSADEMAKLLELETRGAYYKKENGRVKLTLAEAKIIAERFNMTIDDVFFRNEVSQ